jgi:hypothetical protein
VLAVIRCVPCSLEDLTRLLLQHDQHDQHGQLLSADTNQPLTFISCREFQEDVMARAQREMAASAGGSGSVASDGTSTTTFGSAAGAPPDLPALVDDLRAEVASARAVLQQLKLKKQDQPRW